ncbi:MAG: hypothetical protein J6Q89_06670, partial [Clostridia bacterium]|nr:hypothetical protein [Clostridia bacterium]
TCKEGYFIKQLFIDDKSFAGIEGLGSYTYTFENVTENHTIKVEFMTNKNVDEDSGNGTLTTVIVILIIVLVAIAGAAALFVVKWRQEKF